jgi:hypothetical protein
MGLGFEVESMVNGLELMMKRLTFLACIALSGCVTVTDSNVSTLPLLDLCTARIVSQNLGQVEKADLAFSEIQRRGGFTDSELRAIRTNQVFVGMSEPAGLCAWGNGFDAVNTTGTAGGIMKQYVYTGNEYVKSRYLYATNGKISGFQQ